MVYFSKIILVTVLNIIYQTEIAISHQPAAVTTCIENIYGNFGYNIKSTHKLKQNLGRHAMEKRLEKSLATQYAKDYFIHLKNAIYVDEEMPTPVLYCNRLYHDFINIHSPILHLNIILNEISRCKNSLFEFFLTSNDTVEIAKTAYENLLEAFFTPMDDEVYAKKYFELLVEHTHFDESVILVPSKFCELAYLRMKTVHYVQNTTNKRKKPDQEDDDEPSDVKRHSSSINLSGPLNHIM